MTSGEELAIVSTALFDLTCHDHAQRSKLATPPVLDRPALAWEVAERTWWPGQRTFGRARTAKILGELVALGVAKRTRPKGSRFVYEFVSWDGLVGGQPADLR